MSTPVFNLSSLDGSNGFRLDGVTEFEESGRSVSNAGDVNGDGFDDVIVGARGANSSYVVFGKAAYFDAAIDLSGLNGNNGFRLDGEAGSNLLGYSVSNAGDVNGDGFDDMIIGARGANSSYVVFGKVAGFDAVLALASIDGSNGFSLNGVAGDSSGNAVSNAGDFNGDGFDDVIVGDFGADPNGNYSGSSYVIFGKASGFDTAMDLSALDGNTGFRLDGAEAYDFSGSSVSSAGDVNGDGFDDLIIGGSGSDLSGNRSAPNYVVFGKASGFGATLALSSLDGSSGFRMDGGAAGYQGFSVSGAGDINGDGFDDLIIGASGADLNGGYFGSSYVVFGKATDFAPTLNLSSLDGSNGFRLDGALAYDFSGSSVSSAGDVNGDGFDDLIVGAPGADLNGDRSGSSYVVFGKASGFGAILDLSKLDSNSGFRMDGGGIRELSGASVSSAGDVNNDGFNDLIVGAPRANPNGISNAGSSYVVFGSRDFGGGQLPVIPGTPGDDVLRGTSAAEIFEAGDGNDLIVGRGGADVFHGGAGVDQIKVPDLNFESIDGGSGNDILHLDGKDLNLDLTDFGDKIQNIETICLYGRGDNTLTLTAESVLDLSDTSNTLKLHGNAGDRVTVQDDGWVDGGVHGFYHTYTNDDAVLLVGANLAAVFA